MKPEYPLLICIQGKPLMWYSEKNAVNCRIWGVNGRIYRLKCKIGFYLHHPGLPFLDKIKGINNHYDINDQAVFDGEDENNFCEYE